MGLRMAAVRQRVATERVPDVAAAVREGLRALPLSECVRPGMRVFETSAKTGAGLDAWLDHLAERRAALAVQA